MARNKVSQGVASPAQTRDAGAAAATASSVNRHHLVGIGAPTTEASLRLLESLRDATRAAHRCIDHHPLMAPLVRPDLSLTHYHFVLRVLASIHARLQPAHETALARLCPMATYRVSDRLGWLVEDCAFFNLEYLIESPLPVPLAPSPAALVGQIYVVEGSTLGGQVIARQLAQTLDLSDRTGARMFSGHGAETVARWQEFWGFAVANCSTEDIPLACAAAVDLFAYLHDSFDLALQPTGQIP